MIAAANLWLVAALVAGLLALIASALSLRRWREARLIERIARHRATAVHRIELGADRGRMRRRVDRLLRAQVLQENRFGALILDEAAASRRRSRQLWMMAGAWALTAGVLAISLSMLPWNRMTLQ